MLLRTNSVFTFFLVIINTILALMASQYMWSTDTILQWGGMSGSMPVAQTLSQLPPFNLLGNMNLPDFMTTQITGFRLIALRSIYASFLHFSWMHFATNALVLFYVGRMFEQVTYFGSVLMVYLTTGMVSMLSAYYIQPHAITAGASGAIFGIMGAAIVVAYRAQKTFLKDGMTEYAFYFTNRLGKYVWGLLAANIISTVVNMYATTGGMNISIVGHVAGFIAGILIGMVLPYPKY